jgi:DHA1 family bicyclomycin/chloramphenicol resistance-like MFS transporter
LVTAPAPVGAPLIGGQILLWFDWRGIFWVLVGFGLISLLAVLCLPETLELGRRSKAHPAAMALGYFEFLRNARYLGYVACSTFYFCCLFAFIAGSPFAYIEYFKINPQYYGFLFGVNMLGMIASSYTNSRIVVRYGGDRLLRIACAIGAAGAIVLLVVTLSGSSGLVGLAVPLFVVLSLLTVVASNAVSGALSVFPSRAGAAAALAGSLQFGAGALASAIVGWSADGTPRPMIFLICASAIASLCANLVLVRKPE